MNCPKSSCNNTAAFTGIIGDWYMYQCLWCGLIFKKYYKELSAFDRQIVDYSIFKERIDGLKDNGPNGKAT